MQVDVNAFLNDVENLPLAVIGDVMLDRYLFGSVQRISPEAPVPVHAVKRAEMRLGGAGNVVANLARLGASARLYSAVGADEAGAAISSLIDELPSAENRLSFDPSRETTAKMRIVGGQQQMLRVDFEQRLPLSTQAADALLARLEQDISAGLRGVVISDYDKGICTEYLCHRVIELCQKCRVSVVVDPKGTAWEKYSGADLVTPNVAELSLVCGHPVANDDDEVVTAAREISRRYRLERLAVTRSENGITLVAAAGEVTNHPATAREVFDVSGAGDTVCAVLAATCALGVSADTALYLANRAAGIVVGKVGTYPITRQDMEIPETETEDAAAGVFSAAALEKRIRGWQARGETVVFTNGCFDLLHRGHVSYLEAAAKLGQRLVVAVNSDASVRRLKGETRPISRAQDRAYLLQALRCVDAVTIFEEDTPAQLLSLLRPDILVKGGDYRPEDIIGGEFVRSVKVLPFVEGYSTTETVRRVLRGADE